MHKKKVLFICLDNSIRSQMAAAFLNTYFHDRYEAHSAGITPRKIDSRAIKVLKEIGIDINSSCTKGIEDFREMKFDCIVTLCDYVNTINSHFPEAKKHIHKNFKDYCTPLCCEAAKKLCTYSPAFIKHRGKGKPDIKDSEEKILSTFRSLREDIFEWVEKEAVF